MWRIFFGGSTDCPPQGQGTKGAWDILLSAQISFILRHVPVSGAIVNLAFINLKGWSDSLEHKQSGLIAALSYRPGELEPEGQRISNGVVY